MCIAIYKAANKNITRETLEKCFDSNPDGAGFMYVENRNLIISKGHMTFEDFYTAYKLHENKQCAIHFRIKTHGTISEENCHPFNITKSLAFIHNGMISGYHDTVKSDTMLFAEKILTPMITKYGKRLIQDNEFKSLIEERIGWSKLIFLDSSGNYAIYNESKGTWDNGIWYSNSSYKPVQITHHYKESSWEHDYYNDYNHHVKRITANNSSFNTQQCGVILGQNSGNIKYPKNFFLKKKTGMHIYVGDYARITMNFRHLIKDEILEVLHVNFQGNCEVNRENGQRCIDIPGTLLELEYPQTVQDTIIHDNLHLQDKLGRILGD